MIENVALFFSKGVGRHMNDSLNRLREDVLVRLQTIPSDYLSHPVYGSQWTTLSSQWNQFLSTLCSVEYDTIRIEKVANKKSFDLQIDYLRNSNVIHTVLGEFKHNAKSITAIPQYYNAPEKKHYIPTRYAEYFYDHYLDRICQLVNVEKLDRDIYLKHVDQSSYSANPFFQTLKDTEHTVYKDKQRIVRESIKDYLRDHAATLSIDALTHDLLPQSKKTFILWDCTTFRSDCIRDEELQIVGIEAITNNNTIVVVSRAGTKHKMLLRWKNHLGILYPAWQISLQR
jgi:hypothetical protein